jgi:hypothetical protein
VRFTGLKMPLKKIMFRAGVNRENTRYASETMGNPNSNTNVAGGWYESEKVRFRSGTPEKIGGWSRISPSTFIGYCRSLWNWVTLGGLNLMGVGTNAKFYIERDGAYNDITPIRASSTINNNPFALTASTTVTVTDTAHGGVTGDYVTFSGAVGIGGVGTNVTAAVLNQNFMMTVIDGNTYTITISVTPNATAIAGSPGGGASVVAAYEIQASSAIQVPLSGWGGGTWGQTGTTWGNSGTSTTRLRLWSQANFGQNLIFAYRGGSMYYWDATAGLTTRGVLVSSLPGADAEVPTIVNSVFVSDTSRFVFAFGTNDPNSSTPSTLDPMFIRWSDQESVTTWIPAVTNQAGSIRLSHGSEIITAVQTRQEIVVFTDSSIYSLQYQGPPAVWSSQLLGDNISIQSPNAATIASGVVYWMGVDKFYKYDGRVQTLRCDLREYIFSNINTSQNLQVFSSTSEGFNEVWWFYCTADSTTINRYVIYNYAEDIWYYGTDLGRTAWIDSGLRSYPIAATYSSNLVNQEYGVDNNETGTPTPIVAYIESSQFDIDDGHNFGFIWRVLPDLTFRGSSSSTTPQVTMTLTPYQNSGTGANVPASTAGTSNAAITRTSVAPVDEFTGQVYMRVRGRQITFRIESNILGTQWQLGAPRIDIKQDGRRGNS